MVFIFRFPKNEKLRAKWIEALELVSIKSCTNVCSDHFDDDSFVQNEYAVIRRLLPTAVPKKITEKKFVTHKILYYTYLILNKSHLTKILLTNFFKEY